MQQYSNFIWWNKVKHINPRLDTGLWENSNSKLLFPRGSHRQENIRHAEFIHGHSVVFQNFAKIVNRSLSGICRYCESSHADSNSHQLFDCPTFECQHRVDLLTLLDNNIADFQWKLSISMQGKNAKQIVKTYLDLVVFIDNIVCN